MTKYRVALTIVLFSLLMGITVTSFAYWNELIQSDSNIIEIGEGAFLTKTVSVGSEQNLVPIGAALNDSDVEQVVYEYNIKLSKLIDDDMNLTVSANNILVGAATDVHGLINIDIALSKTTINQGKDVTAIVTVTLNMPENEIEYEAVAGKKITFTLTFEAMPA